MAVLVYAEHTEGVFKKSAFEIISYAKQVASIANTSLVALVFGNLSESTIHELGKYGLSRVLSVNTPDVKDFNNENYASAISLAAEKENADIVVLSNSFNGKALAPTIGIKLKASVVSGVIEVPKIDAGKFIVKKTTFSGKAIASIEMVSDKKVITLNPNSFTVHESSANVVIETYLPEINAKNRIVVKETIRSTDKISLPEAEIVVSGGRGLKGPENWNLIEDLAEALNAATACSKPVSDSGWRPHSEHVGQTGIVISPNLYIAAGISGAIQHLAGVSSSKTIVAINKDANAPIFQAADYGIVGDVFEVLPKLTESIKAYKGSV